MKKAIAAVLVASMLVMTACSKTQKETASSNSETEATTTTEETTEAATTTEQKEDTIIPLFEEPYREEVKKVSPEKWWTDFENTYAKYFALLPAGEATPPDDPTLIIRGYNLTKDYSTPLTFKLSNTGNASTEVEVFISLTVRTGTSVVTFSANGQSDSFPFVPLFYNETKQCLAGYGSYNGQEPRFMEVYWDDVTEALRKDADPSLYGF